MDINQEFQEASKRVNNLPKKPGNDVLLRLYGLFKQGSEGDVVGDRPGGFDFKAIAKYNAWLALKGKSQEDAQKEYEIDFCPLVSLLVLQL